MKKLILLLLFGMAITGYSQVIPGEEFSMMVKQALEEGQGAHESVVRSINEEFATSVWGKPIRMNDAEIVRFLQKSSGEKVSAGIDLTGQAGNGWVYAYDQQAAADLLNGQGVNVASSFNTLMITANQPLVQIEHQEDGKKTVMELHCPTQEVLTRLRTGRKQSIEFLITGFKGSSSGANKVTGILTKVNDEKQVSRCANGHEFDKALGYKFCPTCGEPLE